MPEAAWRSAEAGGRVLVANASWMKTEDEVNRGSRVVEDPVNSACIVGTGI